MPETMGYLINTYLAVLLCSCGERGTIAEKMGHYNAICLTAVRKDRRDADIIGEMTSHPLTGFYLLSNTTAD